MNSDQRSPVRNLLEKVARIRDAEGPNPVDGSPAHVEMRSFERRESIVTLYSQASMIAESAADNLKALDILVTMKEFSVAPWVSARAALEASALVAWLLDQDIELKERVGRSLALRYETLRSQEKLAQAAKDENSLSSLRERMNSIEEIAVTLGFKLLRNRKGKRSGIAITRPSNTELVERLTGDDKLYRILCAIAHGDYGTLRQLSFMPVSTDCREGIALIPAIPHELQMNLVARIVSAYARAAWPLIVQYGCDAAETEVVFEVCFSKLGLPDTDTVRFWRVTPGSGI